MLNEYIYKNGKKLRYGYTTGSCATAATKAATQMLLTQEPVKTVYLMTPKGILLNLEVLNAKITKNSASCAIKKDSGDDPDATESMLVYADVTYLKKGIEIDGGEGIGRVTRKGLDQPIGAAAINSVPRKMIKTAVNEIIEKYDYVRGIKVVISIPGGEKVAQKTFNPRLGIVGGLSVIGTSGIVEPMSNAAIIATIKTEEKMLYANGNKNLLLTIGNYSQNFIKEEFPLTTTKNITCSNFIGEAIDGALEFGFKSVLIVGHIGKLVKLGAGIMNTHSSFADGRMDVLVTCGVLAGVNVQTLKKIPNCITVDEALDIFDTEEELKKTMDVLMKRVDYYLNAKVKNSIKIGALVFSNKYGILGKTICADELMTKVLEEYND